MSSKIPKSPKLSKKPQLERTIIILKEELNRLHQDLLQARNDLKLEKTKSMDLSLAVRDAEKELDQHQDEYEHEMAVISQKLLALESSFLKEQKEIQQMLDSKDQIIESLQQQLQARDKSLEEKHRDLSEMKFHFDKELKARDKRIASQWRELEGFKSANSKFIGALSQLRSSQNPLMTRSTSSITRTNQVANVTNPRRALTPNASRKKFRDSSEWKEELSAFF